MSPASPYVRRSRHASIAASMVAMIPALALVAPGAARAAQTTPIVNLPIVNGVTSQLLPGVVNPVLDTVGATVAPLPIVGPALAETTDQVQTGVNETVAPVVDRVTTVTAPLVGAAPVTPTPPAQTASAAPAASTTPASPDAPQPTMFTSQNPAAQLSERIGTVNVAPTPSDSPATVANDPISTTARGAVSTNVAADPAVREDLGTTFAVAVNNRGVRPQDDQFPSDTLKRDKTASPTTPPTPTPLASWGESIVPAFGWSTVSTAASRPRGPPLLEVPVRPA